MAAACFSVMFFMFHMLILNLVKGESKSCPKEFNCGRLGNMSYPFSEVKKPDCELSKIDYADTLLYPEVELCGVSYNAYKKWPWVNGIDLSDSILEGYLANRSCKSLERNLSFPNSPSVSFGVYNNITLFKCLNDSSEKIGDYFRRYENYSNCDGFSLYYHKPRTDRNHSIPAGDLPANCWFIQLPLKFHSSSESIPTDFFDLLTSNFTLDWGVSKDCSNCLRREGQCQSDIKKQLLLLQSSSSNKKFGTDSTHRLQFFLHWNLDFALLLQKKDFLA
ncbi:hypothetical protein K7X08_006749 [Anisodus acutangulus]|uniref:Uncharacterized protein n=1 Tax=Anisodus acutangulus TaxID=402998 RepID=A0A9Q1MWE2_9SOLA|nr:hypothetical protein K7X08_006749 [Anisodus acutangulus]